MTTNIDDYRMKKISNRLKELSESTRQGGYLIAEACYRLAYEVRKYDSQSKANEKQLNKTRNL